MEQADFFEWDATTDRMTIEFWSDDTGISIEYAGLNIVYGGIKNWDTVGNTLNLNFDEQVVFRYNLVGNTVTLTGTEGGDARVLVFTRV